MRINSDKVWNDDVVHNAGAQISNTASWDLGFLANDLVLSANHIGERTL